MIQKQPLSSPESLYQIYSKQQIVGEILRIKHHTHLINYRNQLKFQRFFGNFAQPMGKYQNWAFDVLTFSESRQMLKASYRMGQLMLIYRSVILHRTKQDHIAPILKNKMRQNNIIGRISRRCRKGYVQYPDSNTMHTQSSLKKQKCKFSKIQKIISFNIQPNKKESCNQDEEYSAQTLDKITQDLSRMIQNSCIFQKKSKNLHLRISKIQQNSYKTKDFKRKLMQQNISIIKGNNNQNIYDNDILRFDDPQENYGLKKSKRTQIKLKQQNNKSKFKSLKSNQSKRNLKSLNEKKKKKNQSYPLSPLTPKTVSISKSKQGWGDSLDKWSRYSPKKIRISSSSHYQIIMKDNIKQNQQIKIKKPIPKSPGKFNHKTK